MRGLSTTAARVRLSFDLATLLAAGGLVALGALALIWVGVPPVRPSAYLNNTLLYLTCWFAFELWPYLRSLFAAHPDSPVAFTRDYLRARSPLLLRGLPLIVALVVFMPTFSAMKSSIPLFAPYTWDAAFIEADRAIFGRDAWLALQPVFGFPVVTSALALTYHLWILLIYAGGVYFAVYRRDVRKQYFAVYFGLWTIGGVAMAIGFASVGPCFVGPLLGQDTFASQMAYLRGANDQFPIMVLEVQDKLLAWHLSGQHGLGRGITAMPSMHVGLAFLFWLAMRPVSKRAARFFFAFFVAVWIGSVHLAYHYAVDGLVSVILVWLLWAAAGKVLR